MKQKIIAAIFARGGSKGLPGKNIKLLDGKPLLAYSIEVAKKISCIERIIVSTDDEDIATVARKYGAEVPFKRPATLAEDSTPEWLAWRHLLIELEKKDGSMPEIMVSLPTTAPLRSVEDVTQSLDLLLSTKADAVVGIQKTDRNPYFNMVTMDQMSTIELASQSQQKIHRRQDAPKIYDMTTVVYAVRSSLVIEKDHLFEGKIKAVIIPPERAIDIDTEMDFEWAEFLLKKQKKAIQL